MEDGGEKDDRCPGKYGQNCSNESCRHEQNRDRPPEQFHRATRYRVAKLLTMRGQFLY